MSRVVIVHGFNSWPDSHWFPWLKKELETRSHTVLVPRLPRPLLPNRDEWLAALTAAVGPLGEDTVIVTHSLGTVTALLYLESRPPAEHVRGVVAVAPFVRRRYDILVGDFFERPPDLEALHPRIPHMVVLSDPKDHLVPFADAEYLAHAMHCELEVHGNRGHFDSRLNGVTEVPEVLTAVLKMLANE